MGIWLLSSHPTFSLSETESKEAFGLPKIYFNEPQLRSSEISPLLSKAALFHTCRSAEGSMASGIRSTLIFFGSFRVMDRMYRKNTFFVKSPNPSIFLLRVKRGRSMWPLD
ncbi:DNA-binding protein HU-alpha [Striga asiatica]|uniref:DNA-binding protein HU-alpha n=1 Tax=Striga asiatica TaxID=4170 RepID=A0A5A7PGD2_STRAF|nr:DNA-binding protein HU-alpha [Striga asiatica]